MKTRYVSVVLIVIFLLSVGFSQIGLASEDSGVVNMNPVRDLSVSGASPFGGIPDYDSGWVSIAQDEIKTLQHFLGGNPDDYVVDLQMYDVNHNVNEFLYGSDTSQSSTVAPRGYYGFTLQDLDEDSIQVIRFKDDVLVKQVRVRIWVMTKVDYDSGWKAIDPGETLNLDHDLGGNPDDYVVDLQFKTGGFAGVHNRNYGIDTHFMKNGGEQYTEWGAIWHNLNDKSIQVYRGTHELYVNSVRVRIWRVPDPDYDSGWRDISQDGSEYFYHSLGGPWNDYFIDLQFKHETFFETHQYFYGGDEDYFDGSHSIRGAWLASLDGSQAIVKRGKNDTVIEQVRVRIWADPVPKYDSGWHSIGNGQLETFYHHLGGEPDHYVVDLQSRNSFPDSVVGGGVNQVNYGGDSFMNQPVGPIEFRGVNWLGLTSKQVQVSRGSDDVIAEEVRVRIWIPPAPTSDSLWSPISADGLGQAFVHSVGGDPDDYVVDMQFKDSGLSDIGVHQQDYGGNNYWLSNGDEYWTGVAWSKLNNVDMSLVRGTEDTEADEVRIRIWKNPVPDYDSGWLHIKPGTVKKFLNSLGGIADDYILDLQSRDDKSHGVHQLFYGGSTGYLPGGTPSIGGSYWYGLNRSYVMVDIGVNNRIADNVRVRIWKTGHIPTNIFYLPLMFRDK